MTKLHPSAARPAVARLLQISRRVDLAQICCSARSRPSPSSSLLLPRTAVRHMSGPYGYTQAKALVFSKFGEPKDVLYLHKHSISPSLPDNSVLLRTLAAPINPADVNTIQGTYGSKPTFTTLLGTPEPCAVGGNEGCFEVVSVGSGVSSLKKGDWVVPAATGFGTWRTHALVENAEQALLKVAGAEDKGSLTPIQVATVSVNPCSAYRMLRDFVDLIDLSVKNYASGREVEGGAWFIQNGANSGVGRAAIQLGKLWGLRSINVVRSRPTEEATEKLKKELTELGATVVVTEEEFMDRGFLGRLKELTRGGTDEVQLGLNCVGGKNASQVAKCLGEGGTMVTYGAMSKQPVMLPTGLLIFKDLRFRGFWLSRWANSDKEGKKKTIDEILKLTKEGKFKEAPTQQLKWEWDTKEEILKEAVQGTLQGFRPGKGVFVFENT